MADNTQISTNWDAAAEVYRANGIDLKESFNWWGLNGMPTYDINAAAQEASVDVNFDAIEALAPESKDFLAVIEQHDDLKASVGNLFDKQGITVLKDFEGLVTGNGDLSTDQLSESLQDPAIRGLFVQGIDLVAEGKENGQFVMELARHGLRAATTGDRKDQEAFLKFAKDAGIDTSGVENAAMNRFMHEFWYGDTQGAIIDLIGSMNLPPELANMLVGALAPMGTAMKDVMADWGNDIGQLTNTHSNLWQQSGADMIRERQEQLAQQANASSTPAAPAPVP